jgi:hypothetical protein
MKPSSDQSGHPRSWDPKSDFDGKVLENLIERVKIENYSAIRVGTDHNRRRFMSRR